MKRLKSSGEQFCGTGDADATTSASWSSLPDADEAAVTTLAPRRVGAGVARLLRSAAADSPPNRITTAPPLFFFATASPLVLRVVAAARQDARATRATAAGAATVEAMVQDDMLFACR
jgi:O-acetyl-ADP-ribose deacetylase (regulator of RNase III)